MSGTDSAASADDRDLYPPFDNEPGETVYFGLGGEAVKGVVKDVERGVAAPAFPVPGTKVTFKAVGGEVEKTVRAVNPDAEYPIVLDHGGRYRRTNFVEFTEMETFRIIELDDGREIFPNSGGQ